MNKKEKDEFVFFFFFQIFCKLLVEEQVGTREFGGQFANDS